MKASEIDSAENGECIQSAARFRLPNPLQYDTSHGRLAHEAPRPSRNRLSGRKARLDAEQKWLLPVRFLAGRRPQSPDPELLATGRDVLALRTLSRAPRSYRDNKTL